MCTGDQHIIARRVHGLERVDQSGAVKSGDHVEKPWQFRAHPFDGAQSPIRGAYVERFTKSWEQKGQVVVER